MKNLFLKNKSAWPILGAFIIITLASFSFVRENSPHEVWCSFFQNDQSLINNHQLMQFDYDKAWKEIEDLDKQGLPKSALEKVTTLLETARSENESAHFIKALIYKGKYESQLEEDGLANAILNMQLEMDKAQFPVKPILQSMLAEMYANYFDQNRWQIQNRTQTVDFKNADIRTWTMEQLLQKSAKLYWASLADERSISTDIQSFRLLLVNGENDEGLRPTLYDFLAHRAIDFFANERNYVTQPAYKFEIENAQAFAGVNDFINWTIETRDTSSQKYQTLRLFQDLLRFKVAEKRLQSPSLLDADLKRLSFVYNNAFHPEKDSLYTTALERLQKQYEESPAVADINTALAQHLYNQGIGYQPPAFGVADLDDRKWLVKQAHDLLRQTVKDYPNTVAATKSYQLLSQILQPEMQLETEMVNLPGQPFLAKLTYKNLPQVYLKTIRITPKNKEEFEKIRNERDWRQKAIDYLNGFAATKTWSVALPGDGDFHQHTVEIKMDAMPKGLYAIMVSGNENFQGNTEAISYIFTNISSLGYWERRGDGEGTAIVVFNRESGQPIAGADVEFWGQKYNSIMRSYEYKKRDTKITDANGFVLASSTDREDRNFTVRIKHAGDELITDQYFYNNVYRNEPRPYQQTQFFLDRGIYRPGQTVYFKGIALGFDARRMPSILKNEKVTVTFRDANYQETARLDLRTNEYGTFSGQFVTPRGGLPGSMQIVSSIGGNARSFRVEEYKRPKFEVTFAPVTQSYRLNEEITVTGKAMAYAGNQIDGAAVTWRVVRETRFPWYYGFWKWMPWAGETMEIAHGTATTDQEGRFNIDFAAIPDKSIPAENKPEFSYTIYADVTDITGETQSGQSSVKVGYIAMQVEVPVSQQMNADSLKELTLVTKNLNGEFEPAKGSVTIDLLKAPDQIYLDRYWDAPDKRLITEAEFKKLFPHLAWNNEDKPETWPVARTLLRENFDTEKSKVVKLPAKWQPGWYAITISTQDRYGEKVELKKYVSVFDLQAKTLPTPTLVWHYLDNKTYEPGSVATSHFGTSRKQQPVLLEYEKDGKTLERKWMTVKEISSNPFHIKENHRGNINYHFSYAGMNRSTTLQQTVSVPWSNKDLSIEYGTFRDKLLPGQEEEWVIKIKGPKGEKVAAEMVAGMYDASLDAFAPNAWGMNVFPMSWSRVRYNGSTFSSVNQHNIFYFDAPFDDYGRMMRNYDQLNWFGWNFYGFQDMMFKSQMRTMAMEDMAAPAPEMAMEEVVVTGIGKNKRATANGAAIDQNAPETDTVSSVEADESVDTPPVQIRSNLNETVFFFPHLMTDAEGNVLIKFKMNEALTKWKFLGLAHTGDLKIAATSKEVVTQKDLMIVPNPPRFFRENDEIEFTAKVVNLTDKPLSGNAELQLLNPMNSLPVYKWLDNPQFNRNFTVEAKQSTRLAWRFKVPDIAEVPVIEHTVLAVAGEFSDGERSAAPVLSNRMLVTETKPLPVRGRETKDFVFESLKNNNSTTLRHQGLTLEFTQNPAWYAVQALPYLMEYPYECTEQIFSRYYANSLATSVANSHPKIKGVFDKWRDYQPDALLSNLTKNEELKTALLEETPWVLQAQSEEQQKQNIALLFDLNRMAYEQEASLKKLQDRQMPGGGWSWFPGGQDSWYITQYIVEGFGHLQKLGVDDIQENPATWQMVQQAVRYCDARIVEQYENLEDGVKKGNTKWEDDHLNYLAAHYLYTRSFFLENMSAQASTGHVKGKKREFIPLEGKASQVHDYYLGQAEKYWLNKGMYTEGMLSLAMFRNGKVETARKVIRSLDERSLNHEELGKYWKYPTGWWWYQAPIETHALMIEAFSDISDDKKAVDDLKVWLLKNKQTNHWKTTKATANAVYALLSSGDNWLVDSAPLDIQFGKTNKTDWNTTISSAQQNAEAGTGYFKVRFDGNEVTKDMANIKITNPNNVVAWGAIYWQYFEQLDKITTFEETPLTIKKQLFRVENTDRGEVIRPVNEGDALKVGEKLKVRIELRVERDMEYVHMKDMRASGFEPINVLSTYKWQDGLGYYESTRDAATHFFFSYLTKGTHVFEYPLRVQHNGEFSNGITTIQCMYAPEFSSHSEGIRVKVAD